MKEFKLRLLEGMFLILGGIVLGWGLRNIAHFYEYVPYKDVRLKEVEGLTRLLRNMAMRDASYLEIKDVTDRIDHLMGKKPPISGYPRRMYTDDYGKRKMDELKEKYS